MPEQICVNWFIAWADYTYRYLKTRKKEINQTLLNETKILITKHNKIQLNSFKTSKQ